MADRHQFRANWHDYNYGIYFVTICSAKKQQIFGEIVGTRFIASAIGGIVEEHIKRIPSFYNNVEVWNYVVMPNHIHMILWIGVNEVVCDNSALGCLKPPKHAEPTSDYHHNSRLASVIGAYKAGVTRRARLLKLSPLSTSLWQHRFYEHIIRNQHTFDKIMNYIDTNVENWGNDGFNADYVGTKENNLTIS